MDLLNDIRNNEVGLNGNDNGLINDGINPSGIRICKHICEKKRRRCKFNAIRNCDYCVEHLAFNDQVSLFGVYYVF